MARPPTIRARCQLVRAIDGDTLVVRVDARAFHPEFEVWMPKVRLAGVDAAEANEKGGALATATVADFFAPPTLFYELQCQGRDKYGRLLADVVRSDGQRLSEVILALAGSRPISVMQQLAPA